MIGETESEGETDRERERGGWGAEMEIRCRQRHNVGLNKERSWDHNSRSKMTQIESERGGGRERRG